MKIVVTGSKGFVGQNLLSYLDHIGKLDVYEFNSDNHTEQGKYYIEANDFMCSIPPDIDYVVHLGAVSDHECTDMDIFYSNVSATRNLAAICRAEGVPMIHFSSCAAINPTTLYGWSKYMSERFVWDILGRHSQCTLRPYTIYSEDEPTKGRNPSIYTKIKEKWHIPIYSPCERDFIHVDDVCRAVYSLISTEFQPGVYDLGTGDAVSIQRLYEAVNGHTPNTMVTPNNVRPYQCANKNNMLKNFRPRHHILSWHKRLGD